MQHSGKCDCGCGQHSIWTIVHSDHGRKLWFLALDHLWRWQTAREAPAETMGAGLDEPPQPLDHPLAADRLAEPAFANRPN
jgi:hypothetical protein